MKRKRDKRGCRWRRKKKNPSFIFIHRGQNDEIRERIWMFWIRSEKEKKRKERVPCTAKLVELAAAGEDDESDLGIAKNRELVGLFEEAISALGECDLAVDFVLYSLQFNSSSSHSSF